MELAAAKKKHFAFISFHWNIILHDAGFGLKIISLTDTWHFKLIFATINWVFCWHLQSFASEFFICMYDTFRLNTDTHNIPMPSRPREMVESNRCEHSLHGVRQSPRTTVEREPRCQLTQQAPKRHLAAAAQFTRKLVEVEITDGSEDSLHQTGQLYLLIQVNAS